MFIIQSKISNHATVCNSKSKSLEKNIHEYLHTDLLDENVRKSSLHTCIVRSYKNGCTRKVVEEGENTLHVIETEVDAPRLSPRL